MEKNKMRIGESLVGDREFGKKDCANIVSPPDFGWGTRPATQWFTLTTSGQNLPLRFDISKKK
ncbi:hypothetical protein CH364_09740 [Leptospira harrisiae]|uniref:Uncharacterized protein n=1 Tax=Leptospira harrisiae TaxID=2023189 RepID=A0A2N0AQ85_9LEPT|nr:hypothetical protein CH364_09740 [Leptospira harrisiae]